jgi:hypothetical protein
MSLSRSSFVANQKRSAGIAFGYVCRAIAAGVFCSAQARIHIHAAVGADPMVFQRSS